MTNSVGSRPTKEPYQKPTLRIYGNIKLMTGTTAALGMVDDNPQGGVKTA